MNTTIQKILQAPRLHIASRFRARVGFFAVLITSVVSTVSASNPVYSIADLGSLPGYSSYANDINDRGQVVGSSGNQAFLYSDGQMVNLGTFGQLQSYATAINNSGQIAGDVFLANTSSVDPFFYSGGHGQVLPIGESRVNGITTSGQVFGMLGYGNYLSQGFQYSISSGALSYFGCTSVTGINDKGQVAGWLYNNSGWANAYIFSGSGNTFMGIPGYINSYSTGLNNNGQAVGYGEVDGRTHAFLYSGGAAKDLGTFGGTNSIAYEINDNGDVVGYAQTGNGQSHAFVYSGGRMSDLNDLYAGSGWVLTSATAINSSGQIVGDGVNSAGQAHAFLLTPISAIPEPSTYAALAGAIVFGFAILRRKKRSEWPSNAIGTLIQSRA